MKKNILVIVFLAILLFLTACSNVNINGDGGNKYIDYKESEKNSIVSIVGEVVPFMPNSNYTIEFNSNGYNMTVKGVTKEDYSSYVSTLKGSGYVDSVEEVYDDGNIQDFSILEKGNVLVVVFYRVVEFEDEKIEYVQISVSLLDNEETQPDNPDTPVVTPGEPDGGDTPTEPATPVTPTTDFTSEEQALFNGYFGLVIPFLEAQEYYVEDYYAEYYCVNYYTIGNTETDYENYKSLLLASGYAFTEEYVDDYGDTCYVYVKNNVAVDLCAYISDEGDYVIDIYVYFWEEDGGDTPTEPSNPSTGTTVTDILNEASSLGADESLAGDRTVTGTVKEITEAYTTQYKNISFILTDGVSDILIHRGYGDVAATLKVGDTVTVSGEVINYKGTTIEFKYPDLTASSTGGDSGNTGSYTYTEFASDEKELFITYIGEEIPFIPTNEYYIEGYYDETGYEYGMNFYTFGNTESDFNSYKNTLVSWGYSFYESYEDEYGDTWYTYINDDVVIDVCFYYYEGDYVFDLYIYSSLSKDLEDDGTTGGNTNGGNSGDVDLITNEGKGLPSGENGVHNVDFTDAKYVKDVTDQGYYLDGCPTTGDVKVLVIPVEFSDRTASSLGYTLDRLETAFNGTSGTKYYSVSEYYFKSSYGKLNLEFDILDSWFKPSNTSSYYKNYTMDYYGSEIMAGDQVIMDEALAYLESRMDLSEYDSDNNGVIDAVVMISTIEIGDDDFNWAYRYWNLYTDEDGYYYEYDGVSANDYLWASYEFMFETYDSEGNVSYTDKTSIDTYTYIHEFGHVLGCDDYYDTAYKNEPMQGCDIMDSGLGDHNPFTKFNYGWLTTSRVVTTDSTVTLTLEDFSKNGDTIIIANNWDDELGAYQEYYVIMYYRMTGLNGGDAGYFATDGIIVYHVNASLYVEESDGETYYDIYYNNTDASDYYGTEENLIEIVETKEGTIVHREGMTSSSNITDDNGSKISYVFTVDSLTDTTATITFTKNN